MDKALVYGTRDSGFDPQWSRVLKKSQRQHFEAELLLVLPPTISADGGWCEVSSWHHSGDYGFLDISSSPQKQLGKPVLDVEAYDFVSTTYKLLSNEHCWYSWAATNLNQCPLYLLTICHFVNLDNRRVGTKAAYESFHRMANGTSALAEDHHWLVSSQSCQQKLQLLDGDVMHCMYDSDWNTNTYLIS
ncbi:hypothetical protein GmHk_10G027559 [Glycine max]|nr:hypothetical protein GmHk_10G027559 [Glycine max]